MDNRGIDTEPGWVNRQLRELRQAIEALRSERRSAATEMSANGVTVFKLGLQNYGDYGMTINREDGSPAVAVRKEFANVAQVVTVTDDTGNALLAEESLGSGLKFPILHIPMQPVQAVAGTLQCGPFGWQLPIATATFTSTHQAWYARGNQYGAFRVQISASDTTTAAEVRVINIGNGDQLGPFLSGPWTGTRAAGSTGFVEVVSPALFLPGNPNENNVRIGLQVRRSAGAGTLQVALTESHGGG